MRFFINWDFFLGFTVLGIWHEQHVFHWYSLSIYMGFFIGFFMININKIMGLIHNGSIALN